MLGLNDFLPDKWRDSPFKTTMLDSVREKHIVPFREISSSQAPG